MQSFIDLVFLDRNHAKAPATLRDLEPTLFDLDRFTDPGDSRRFRSSWVAGIPLFLSASSRIEDFSFRSHKESSPWKTGLEKVYIRVSIIPHPSPPHPSQHNSNDKNKQQSSLSFSTIFLQEKADHRHRQDAFLLRSPSLQRCFRAQCLSGRNQRRSEGPGRSGLQWLQHSE